MDVDYNAENLKETLLRIMEEWEINDKIISGCITNNGSNIVICMQLSWPHLS